MAQETLVLQLDRVEQKALEERLQTGSFEFRSVPHARFSARGEGIVVTLYNSGKLVLQGGELGFFQERYLADRAQPEAPKAGWQAKASKGPLIGSDETGKGDYFGPLVVVAFKLLPQDRRDLERSGVMDSKKVSDERVRVLAPALMESFDYAVETLDPSEYNRTHARVKNLNPMLADLHAQAIKRLAEPGMAVLVDQFANERLLRERLADAKVELHQMPRAEQEMAVAAASIIARAVFLERIDALSEEYAIDLHKGAGPPVDRAARRFVQLHGFEKLGSVAKLHFKNTQKIKR